MKNEVIIVVENGCIAGVFSTKERTKVSILNRDTERELFQSFQDHPSLSEDEDLCKVMTKYKDLEQKIASDFFSKIS